MFLGSNFDWGQDLFRLKRWANDHPRLRPLAVAYYGPMVPTEIGLATDLPPAVFFQHPHEVPAGDLRADLYFAISSNGLHALPCHIVGGVGAGAVGLVRSPLLRPENAVVRVGHSIYVFRIGPRGGSSGGNRLAADGLMGCIKQIEPEDLRDTP